MTSRAKIGTVLFSCLMITGCGASDERAQSDSRVVAHRSALGAGAINLRAADLPAMTDESNGGRVADTTWTERIGRCGGAFPMWEPGGVRSARFVQRLSDGEERTVVSAVRIAASAGAAKKAVRADSHKQVRRCVQPVYAALMRGGALAESTASIAVGRPVSLPGAVGTKLSLSLRTIYRPAAAGGSVEKEQLVEDIVVFVVGRVEVALTEVDDGAFTGDDRLLEVLSRRAAAYAKASSTRTFSAKD